MSQQKYSEEFKDEAVRLSEQSGKSVRIVAEELGVSRAALQQWRQLRRSPRRRRGSGAQGTTDQQKERPQITVDAEEYRQMKRELELTRQERDILKKAIGYFAQPPR
jgi:transposase